MSGLHEYAFVHWLSVDFAEDNGKTSLTDGVECWEVGWKVSKSLICK